jgi:hypothetical protein
MPCLFLNESFVCSQSGDPMILEGAEECNLAAEPLEWETQKEGLGGQGVGGARAGPIQS